MVTETKDGQIEILTFLEAIFARGYVKETPSLMIVNIMIILKIVYLYKNNAEYSYEVIVFTKILNFYLESSQSLKLSCQCITGQLKIDHLFTIKKKIKSVTLPRSSFVCMIQ